VSIELDVEAKSEWKARQLAILDKELTIKELRKRLQACGCSTSGKKDVLLARFLELPDSKKRRGVLPTPREVKRSRKTPVIISSLFMCVLF
jgi:hypothetical protein